MELLHQALKGRLLNKLEEAAIVESLGDVNINLVNNVQFNMFNNFINYIYKNENDAMTCLCNLDHLFDFILALSVL